MNTIAYRIVIYQSIFLLVSLSFSQDSTFSSNNDTLIVKTNVDTITLEKDIISFTRDTITTFEENNMTKPTFSSNSISDTLVESSSVDSINYSKILTEYKEHYDNELIKISGFKLNGIKSGEWKSYSENGILTGKGSYENDKRIGIWVKYDLSGNIIKRKNFSQIKILKADSLIKDSAMREQITIESTLKNAISYYKRGSLYGDLGKYDMAISDYTMAIELNPKYAEAYNSRGVLYADLYDQIEFNSKFSKKAKKRMSFYDNLKKDVKNREVKKKYKKVLVQAISDFTKAIKLKPGFSDAYLFRGQARVIYAKLAPLGLSKNYRISIEDFTKVIKLDPNYAEAYLCRGNAYCDFEKWKFVKKRL